MIDPLFEHLTAYLDQAAPHHLDPGPSGQLQCGSCQGEWVIAAPPPGRTWHCPWCGHYARLEPRRKARTTPTTMEDRPDG